MELRYREWIKQDGLSPVRELLHSIALILALTDKYTSVVTNPPYMNSSNMNVGLKAYVDQNYAIGKPDLMTVFMMKAFHSTVKGGVWSMIDLPSWMFLSSFEEFRKSFLDKNTILSLLHLGRGIFGSDFGTVSFVVRNSSIDQVGVYRRLFREHVQVRSVDEIRRLFFDNSYGRFVTNQKRFQSIPGSSMGYWLSDNMLRVFQTGEKLKTIGDTRQGMATSDNKRFLRLWFEVSICDIGLSYSSTVTAHQSGLTWFPYNKGGLFRKWYGNQEYVLLFNRENYDLLATLGNHLPSRQYYFTQCISWSKVSSGSVAFRYYPNGFVFDVAGCSIFYSNDEILKYHIGLLNSRVVKYILSVLSPTMNFEAGHVASIPVLYSSSNCINDIVTRQIYISRLDWDAHETSWNFKENELVRIYKENQGEGIFMHAHRLEDSVALYREHWTELFNQLHSNEEELNRQFIEIYGLQNELNQDVPLDEITILQQGEISIEKDVVVWHNDVLAKQLLSYAVGCMMGRYRLDRPGLHIAYPNPSSEDIAPYDFQGESFEIDDDGIIPLLGRDCPFDDNAYNRIVKFIRQVFGESFLNENLNFIEASLGRTIEDYFVKDFWKDHKKMYSNRPIYWLFSSKKGAFQCLTYMHRMNPYTAEAVRSKYLLPYIEFLKNKISADMERASSLSTIERRNLDKMQKALDECLEYEEVLHDVADHQIRFDLNDGVVVNYAKFGDVLAKIK